MSNKWIISLITTGIILIGLNIFFLDNFVTQSYNNGNSLVDYFYPRFSIEKHRLPISFFIEKKDQVIYRLLILIGILVFTKKSPKIKTQPIASIETNIKGFYLCVALFTMTWIKDIPDLVNMNLIYQPVRILKLFTLPQPSLLGLYLLISLTILGAFYSIIKTRPIVASLSLFGFILMQAIFSSYQKIDHGFTSLIYLGFTFCLFLFRKKEHKDISILATLILSLCYCQAGLEKLLISGLELFNTENVLTHLANHPTTVSDGLANYPILSESLFILVTLFQISFPIILFIPKLKKFYIFGGILFHLSTYFFLGVGWWISPWSIALLLLLDWNPILGKLKFANK